MSTGNYIDTKGSEMVLRFVHLEISQTCGRSTKSAIGEQNAYIVYDEGHTFGPF